MRLKGIQFLVDDAGDKSAVVIDLKRYRRQWEDLYDRLLSESRQHEPREPFNQVSKRLLRKWERSDG